MKVLHVVENFGAAGLENVVRNIVLNHRMDVPPQVCVLNDLGCNGALLRDRGFKVWPLHWKTEGKSTFRLLRDLRAIMQSENIDIVHAHNFSPFYFCALASAWPLKKMLVTFHGFIIWRRPYTQAYALLSLVARKIVVVSDAMLDHYRPLFGSRKKLATISNGIDIARFSCQTAVSVRSELEVGEGDFVLGSIGRISPIKNYPMQIRLVAALKDEIPNLKLVLVTSPSPDSEGLEKELKALAKELGVAGRVVFAGFRTDVENVLKSIDVFLMTSFSEGTSMAILEAFAARVPVVASNVGGNGALIGHGVNGMLFDVKSSDQLRDQILGLYRDQSNLAFMALHAEQAAQEYSIDGMVARYELLYEGVLS